MLVQVGALRTLHVLSNHVVQWLFNGFYHGFQKMFVIFSFVYLFIPYICMEKMNEM